MRVEIRPWQLSDAPALVPIMADERVRQNLRALPDPYTVKDAAEYIQICQAADPNETFAFAVTADGTLAGSITVYRKDNIHRQTGELGYCFSPAFWGRASPHRP